MRISLGVGRLWDFGCMRFSFDGGGECSDDYITACGWHTSVGERARCDQFGKD